MFITSYATYVPTITKTKTDFKKEEFSFPKKQDFTPDTLQKNSSDTEAKKPIKSISKYLFFNETQENNSLTTFKQLKKVQQAQNAYEQNRQPNSFMQLSKAKPVVGKLQTPQLDILKTKGVNTYIENDNYYKITAA